ncbi:MAG: 6-phosphofructokinase [Bacteroidetes bacterium]|nr:6-phosphofructokinase [Bacteroidota bacterium]HET6245210.1 6-phosphofructokinase [Bacteroidia bacterium]
MKKIAVFTSGGDSPGMNAAIRAVVRAGIYNGLDVYGIVRGYDGMINGDIIKMESHSVGNIIQRGGTILKSARSARFFTYEGRKQAFEKLQEFGIEALVAIGGDGTFKGAEALSKEFGVKVIGLPGTIDNDLRGTDFTIGYDTAINTVVEAVDKLRDTADSHDRLFVVEVMGRDAGFIAMRSGIGAGAEAVLVPENPTYIDQLVKVLDRGWRRQKMSSIIIVAEGDESGGAFEVARKIKEKLTNYDIRVTILGHVQRGGSPSCMDRLLASRLGVAAVEGLIEGKTNVMAGVVDKNIKFTPFSEAIKHHTVLNGDMMRLVEILSI